MKLVYLNANILYGECLKLIEGRGWKRKIKTDVLNELISSGYALTTSILTKAEVIQRLIYEENCFPYKARKLFSNILIKFDITLICSLNKRNLLTNTFMDVVSVSSLGFKDALHLDIASKKKLIVVTHDKKFRNDFSKHKDKLKFYSAVVKPEELLNN